MDAILDRFEGDYGIVETNQGLIIISRQQLPDNCKEGDVLYLDENDVWLIDSNATLIRQKIIKQKAKELWKK